jgi:hypothetical protein
LVLYLLRKKGGLLNSLLISANFSCLFLSYNFLYFLLILFDGSLADSNNKNLGNTPAERQRNQKLVNSNNQNYARIDKSKGEDLVFTVPTITAACAANPACASATAAGIVYVGSKIACVISFKPQL